MRSSNTLLHLTLSHNESYLGNPNVLLHLVVNDSKRLSIKSPLFDTLCLRKKVDLTKTRH